MNQHIHNNRSLAIFTFLPNIKMNHLYHLQCDSQNNALAYLLVKTDQGSFCEGAKQAMWGLAMCIFGYVDVIFRHISHSQRSYPNVGTAVWAGGPYVGKGIIVSMSTYLGCMRIQGT